jgi:hypothetical protein
MLVQDPMLACIEKRFGSLKTPRPVEWLSDNRLAEADRSASCKDDGQ